MKERGILFSAPMVRALLAGAKTQTRRIVKPQPPADQAFLGWIVESTMRREEGCAKWGAGDFPYINRSTTLRCPYGQPGDRLWVRETWQTIDGEHAFYRADYAHDPEGDREHGVTWRPSIFMPRWASRITLKVAAVRVERLQDISEADSIAEGTPGGHGAIPGYAYNATPGEHYRWLWESINGPGSWDANPWVWVIEFRRLP